jgi:hypothetical protein
MDDKATSSWMSVMVKINEEIANMSLEQLLLENRRIAAKGGYIGEMAEAIIPLLETQLRVVN